jgi:hypothetical protein
MQAEARPRSRFGVSLRQIVPWWIGLCLFAALSWVATVAWAGPMGAGPSTMGLSLTAFLPV